MGTLTRNALNDVTIYIFIEESSFGNCLAHNIDIKILILELPTKLFTTYHQNLTYYDQILLVISSQFQGIIQGFPDDFRENKS